MFIDFGFNCIVSKLNPVHLVAAQNTEEANVTTGINRQSNFKNQVAPAGIVEPNHQEEDSKETIPINATLISAGFVVLMIIIGIISMGINIDNLSRTLTIKLISDLFRAVRCPIIALVTYQARKNKGPRILD